MERLSKELLMAFKCCTVKITSDYFTCKCTFKCLGTCVGKNRSVYAPIKTLTTVQTGKHTTHTFYKIIKHTQTHCTAGRLADSLGRYQAFDGVLGSSTLVGQKCVCVCVFVVKSTLATVCLSISPV